MTFLTIPAPEVKVVNKMIRKGAQEVMLLNMLIDNTTTILGTIAGDTIDPDEARIGKTIQADIDVSELPTLAQTLEWFSDHKFDFKKELLKRSGSNEKVITEKPVDEWSVGLIECYIATIVVFEKSEDDKLKTIKEIREELMEGLEYSTQTTDFLMRGFK